MVARFGVSERRACKLLKLPRSTARYACRRTRDEAFETALREMASHHPGAGYRQIHRRLRRAGWSVNVKRVYRLYQEFGLQRRRTRRHRRIVGNGSSQRATRVNQVWAMDFMSDRLSSGRKYRLLTVIDCCSRECLTIDVNGSMSGTRVVRILSEIALSRGLPGTITVDNGPEFRSKTLQAWAVANGVQLHYIDPGRPTQNAFIESFNAIVRAECLEIREVDTFAEARGLIDLWRADYNRERGHGSLSDRTPAEYAATAPREPFRALKAHQAIRSDNLRLMEKRKTQAFPSFPQAPPRSATAAKVP